MWRAFDVGAVIDSLPFEGAELVAGSTGTARVVTRARLAASPGQLRRVASHEVVVTTAEILTAPKDGGTRIVARLDAAGVAGLAVRLAPSGQLPTTLIAAADKLSLPVITFPREAALADVTAAVLDALLEAQGQRLDRFLDIHQRFTRIMLAGGGIAEVATTLYEIVRRPVAVTYDEGRAAVVVPSGATIDDAADAVRQPISAGNDHYGEILAGPGAEGLDPDQMVALEWAAAAVAVRLAQASAMAQSEERFAAISLEELIAGHSDVADVIERAKSFGWDLTVPRAVLLASIDPPDEGPIPSSALNAIAAAARATLGRDSIVWTRTATIAALLAPVSDGPAERRRLAEDLRRELDVRVRNVTVSIGVGRRVDTPSELSRSYVEASRAVDVGRWAKGRHVTELYDELGLERLLAATPTDDLAEFVNRAIGPLIGHDRSHHTDLVETLAVWLETRNVAEAARRLFVHYNTLKNRLERIEGIVGPVLTNAAHALECEVAIYVHRHYDVPWGGPS